MTDDISSAVGTGLGLALGVGLGVFTLRMLNKLSSPQRTQIQRLMSKATLSGDFWTVRVRNHNLIKARKLLNGSGFRIRTEYEGTESTKYIVFQEKYK